MEQRTFKRELVIDSSIIVGSVFLFLAGMAWLRADLKEQVLATRAARAAIISSSRSVEALASLRQSAADAVRYEKALQGLLPAKEELLSLARKMDTMARIRNVSLNFGFRTDTTEPGATTPGSVGVSLGMRGSLADIGTFLEEIEAGSQTFILRLEGISLSRDGSTYALSTGGRVFFR